MSLPVRSLSVVLRWLTFAALLFATAPALAQYDPRAAFAPFPMDEPVNVYRSANGLPGPQYWQNRADYAIHATLELEPHLAVALRRRSHHLHQQQPRRAR